MNYTIFRDIDNVAGKDFNQLFEAVPLGSKILVTGSYGLIGGYLVDMFCCAVRSGLAEYQILGVDNGIAGDNRRGDYAMGFKQFSFIRGSVWDSRTVQAISNFRPEYIFNCASIASPVFYRKYPVETMEANIEATLRLLEAANLCGSRMIQFSSSEVYGDPTEIPTPETYSGNVSLFGDRACYDESKRVGEVLCYLFHQLHRVRVTVVRPFNIYGPGQRLDDGRIVPSLMRTAVDGRITFEVINGGQATRSFCYISDALRQILWVVEHGKDGDVYNIGDGESEVTVNDMVALMEKIRPGFSNRVRDVQSPFVPGPSRRRPDMGKMPVKPQIRLLEGLTRTFESYGQS